MNFIFKFLCIVNNLKILFYYIKKKKLILINEAGGLGDYLWVRSYFEVIKQSEKYKDYKLVFCGTKRWRDFALKYDSKNVDAWLFFNNPYNPKSLEYFCCFFVIFNIFVNFRLSQYQWAKFSNSVKAKKIFGDNNAKQGFYIDRNNSIITQLLELPNNFKHSLPLLKNTKIKLPEKYIVLVPSGYSMGELTKEQLNSISNSLYNKYKLPILFLGEKRNLHIYKELKSKLNCNIPLINCCNKIKESELPSIINNATLIVTPNTSIYHIALLRNKPCICFLIKDNNFIKTRTDLVLYICDDKSIQNIAIETIQKELENYDR